MLFTGLHLVFARIILHRCRIEECKMKTNNKLANPDIKPDIDPSSPLQFVIGLMPGKIMDVQINSPCLVRLKLPLIGYELGKYLILKYPASFSTQEYADVLQEGNTVVVRYILEGEKGECVAFSTTIRAITTIHEKLIFLNYPKKVENRQLRSAQRQQSHIPAKIEMTADDGKVIGGSVAGVIKDISDKGCQFSFKSAGANKQARKANVLLSIFYGTNAEAVQVKAIVRNSRNEHGVIYVGIQFEEQRNKALEELLESVQIENF
jgi:hypothetical protein